MKNKKLYLGDIVKFYNRKDEYIVVMVSAFKFNLFNMTTGGRLTDDITPVREDPYTKCISFSQVEDESWKIESVRRNDGPIKKLEDNKKVKFKTKDFARAISYVITTHANETNTKRMVDNISKDLVNYLLEKEILEDEQID